MKKTNHFNPVIYLLLLFVLSGLKTTGQQVEKLASSPEKGKTVGLWTFDNDLPGFVTDQTRNKPDSLYGKCSYVAGVKGKAIVLDGFRCYAKLPEVNLEELKQAFSVQGWMAPAAYPWSMAPLFDCTGQQMSGFFLGIDELGKVCCRVAAGGSWYEVKSGSSVPLREWSHLAAVFKANDRIALFINGENVGSVSISGTLMTPEGGFSAATVGRTRHPQLWKEAQLTTPNAYFFLDGALDEISLSATALSGKEVKEYLAGLGKLSKPALSDRANFPSGPAGSGTFGAFYTRLDYYKEWDDLWRVGDKPDVYVRFDRSPVQLMFWRGTSFVPCWVSENHIWYTNEWMETWGKDVSSCAEPCMDREGRYSHVRIIESNDARVVVHWRYALADAFYKFVAVSDDGNGEWCDEYYIIYPDNIGIRRIELHYSKPERKHDWEEQIILTPPGKYPADLIEKESISLVNMKGEIKNYLWNDKVEVNMPEPKGANISYVNLKAKYRPFFILPDDPVETVEGKWDSPFFRTYAANMAGKKYRPDSIPSVYGWWNHWPVTRIPGDGRWVVTPDKPGHFNLTTFDQWKDYSKTEHTRTRIMLHGMTNKGAGDLVPLAKSWLKAPEMVVSAAGFTGGRYEEAERAYLLERSNNGTGTLDLVIKGSVESPIVNPAIIIRNWGKEKARVFVNGKAIQQEGTVRQGIRSTPYGDDLILWIQTEGNKTMNVSLKK